MTEFDRAELIRLGDVIRERRRSLGLSQGRAAAVTGIHRNYIGALERGEVNPTYATLLRVSAGLGMPLERLIADARTGSR
jgi:transcriptional regulator with XRE-family HTH domain